MTIHHSRFGPDEYTFHQGDTVIFVIANNDPIDHEFILGDQAVQDRHELGTEAHHDAIPTEVSLPAGETVRTTSHLRQSWRADPRLPPARPLRLRHAGQGYRHLNHLSPGPPLCRVAGMLDTSAHFHRLYQSAPHGLRVGTGR